MPNKYEREIEEILRNMERTEPRQGLSNRIRAFNRPRPKPRREFGWKLNVSETLLIGGILLALAAAAMVYYKQGGLLVGPYLFPLNGLLAVLAFACIVSGLIIAWRDRFGYGRPPIWRGTVIDMTPRRRNPFSAVATQMRIFRLKMRYWRTRGRQ